MSNAINFEQHPSMTLSSDVHSIIMPLVKKQGVTVFNYYRIYYDKRALRLSSETRWSKHYFEQGYMNALTLPDDYLKKPINYYLWQTDDCPEMLLDAAQNFDISNGISIAVKQKNYIEYFCFATKTSNQSIINRFYLNNLDTLYQNAFQFRKQATGLIKEALLEPIILDNEQICRPPSEHNVSENLNLSPRQQEVGLLLLNGMIYKEIANKLQLSPKTVEFYVTQMKSKFDCNNKSQLVLKLNHLLG